VSLVINTNINALAAQSSAGMAAKAQSKAMQRLSTGLSINSAADDAAGLAISNRMTSNINGLSKAIKNANDGINMAQTADSALSNTTSILQRMRELAVQASNGSNSDSNRQSIQAEVSQLKTQIDQIATSTNFNDINLLDGSAGKIQLQVGINQGQTMNMNFDSTLTKDIGIGSRASLTSIAKSANAMSYGDLTINGVQVGPSLATSDNLSSIGNAYSAISKVAAINAVSAQSGVVASVLGTSVNGLSMSPGVSSGTITINGVQTAIVNTTTDASISRQTVVQAINNISTQTGVTAVDTGDSVHGVQLFAADGRNVSVTLNSTTGNPGVGQLTTATTGLQNNNSVVLATFSTPIISTATQIGLSINGTNLSGISFFVPPPNVPLSNLANQIQFALRTADGSTDLSVLANSDTGVFKIISASGRSLSSFTMTGNAIATQSPGGAGVGEFQLSSVSAAPIVLGSAVGGNIGNADLAMGTFEDNVAQTVSSARKSVSSTSQLADISTSNISYGTGDGANFQITINGVLKSYVTTTNDTNIASLGQDIQSFLQSPSGFNLSGASVTVYSASKFITINTGSQNSKVNLVSFTPSGTAGKMTGSVLTSLYSNSSIAQSGQLDGSSLMINGIMIGAAISTDDLSSDTTAVSSLKSESSIAIAAAINKSTNLTGVTAIAQPNVIVGSNYLASASGPGTIYLNGVTINNSLGANSTRADVVNVLNAYAGQTGVVATDNGKGLTLTAADGRNISIAFSNAPTVSPYALGVNLKNVYYLAVDPLHATTTYSQVALQSNQQFTVQSGSSGDGNLNALGFSVGTFGGAAHGLKIAAIDVSTQIGAQSAITAIDAALVNVSANQSRAGALINRLNDVVANQTCMQSNMTASRSAVIDTDYSTETTNLAKSQIISQAATAMLAQANQSSQNVLALLK